MESEEAFTAGSHTDISFEHVARKTGFAFINAKSRASFTFGVGTLFTDSVYGYVIIVTEGLADSVLVYKVSIAFFADLFVLALKTVVSTLLALSITSIVESLRASFKAGIVDS